MLGTRALKKSNGPACFCRDTTAEIGNELDASGA